MACDLKRSHGRSDENGVKWKKGREVVQQSSGRTRSIWLGYMEEHSRRINKMLNSGSVKGGNWGSGVGGLRAYFFKTLVSTP